MKPGLVSVMMPAYNAEQYIGPAIESVLAQSYPDWELLIVNDGSTDRTADIVTQFTDPRIKVSHQANGGEAAARNLALEQMQGEFVAFLDADDVYLTHHLEGTVDYLQTHPDRHGVYTDGYYCDQEETRLQTLSSRRRGPFDGGVFEALVYGSDVFGPPVCVVLCRHIITQYDLKFDADITIGPDWVFFMQYANAAKFGYVSQHTCLYRLHRANITARINLQKRALELAKCRIKAIKMDNFKACSLHTRWNVFYDLLVNLLRGCPERQSVITQWPEFRVLSPEHQARLFRLMASKAVMNGDESRYIDAWLRRCRQLNPADRRGRLISAMYNLSPWLCRQVLRTRTLGQKDPLDMPPFADLGQAYSR
jgi:glycosyltransferase involved in cell wall biosynthesis